MTSGDPDVVSDRFAEYEPPVNRIEIYTMSTTVGIGDFPPHRALEWAIGLLEARLRDDLAAASRGLSWQYAAVVSPLNEEAYDIEIEALVHSLN